MKAPRNVVAVIVRLFEEPNTCYMQVLESVTALRSSDKVDTFPVIMLDERCFEYNDLARNYWRFMGEATNFFYFAKFLNEEVVLT